MIKLCMQRTKLGVLLTLMLLTIFILFLDWTEQDQENKNMEIDCHYRRVDNQIKKQMCIWCSTLTEEDKYAPYISINSVAYFVAFTGNIRTTQETNCDSYLQLYFSQHKAGQQLQPNPQDKHKKYFPQVNSESQHNFNIKISTSDQYWLVWPDLNSLDIDSRATSWSKVNYLYTLHFIGLIATSFLFALVIIIVKSLLKGLRIEMSLILALLLALYLLYLVAYHTHFEDFRKGYQAVISVTAWAMLSKTKQDYHIFRISCRKIAHVLAILNCFLMLIQLTLALLIFFNVLDVEKNSITNKSKDIISIKIMRLGLLSVAIGMYLTQDSRMFSFCSASVTIIMVCSLTILMYENRKPERSSDFVGKRYKEIDFNETL